MIIETILSLLPILTNFDILLNKEIINLWNPLITKLMILISYLFDPLVIIILSIIIAIIIYKKQPKKSLFLLFSISLGTISLILLKMLIHRDRPINSLIHETGYSFPSGHVVLTTIFFLFLIYIFKDNIKNTFKKYLFISSNILLIVIVAFDRIYLNVHWFSDILAGISLGLFWITFLFLIFKIKTKSF